jgi:hypothetical protein
LLLFGGFGRFGLVGFWSDWALLSALLLLVPLFIFLMIEVGAIRIAPAAENHSGIVRLLVLLVVLVTGAAGLLSARAGWMIVVGQVFAVPFIVAALCEPPPTVPGVFRPLARLGRTGDLLSRIFAPGWHTGFLYVILLWLLIGFFWVQAGWLEPGTVQEGDAIKRQLSLAGFGVSFLLPAVIAPSLSRRRFLYILVFSLLCLAVFSVTSAVLQNSARAEELIDMTAFLPPLAVFAPAYDSLQAEPQLIAMVGLALISIVLYLFKSRTAWRQTRKLRELARQKPLHVA